VAEGETLIRDEELIKVSRGAAIEEVRKVWGGGGGARGDQYVFGPSGSRSIGTRFRSGVGSFYHQAKTSIPLFDFFMTLYL
jgi:hypothetical protein